MYQNLNKFNQPASFRGRSAITVQLWWLVQATLFACSPQFLYGWRNFLLRLFGAKIGKNCLIGANALIPENMVIPDGSLVVGSPGKIKRPLTAPQMKMLEMSATHYVRNGLKYRAQLREQT